MDNKKWDNIGEQIKNTVDRAVQNGDFSDLSRSIGNIVNDTIESVKGSVKAGFQNQGSPYTMGDHHRRTHSMNQPYGRTREWQERRGANGAAYSPAVYQQNPAGKVGGILMTVAGYTGMVAFGIAFLVFAVMGLLGHLLISGVVAFGALTLVSLVLGVRGSVKLGFYQRFQRYIRSLNQQVYIPIQKLADKTGKSLEYTTKDLKNMIDRRLFLQAHIDEADRCLILTDQAYQEYMTAKKAYSVREKQAEEERRERDRMPEECKKIIEEGEAYIHHIHWCNEQIPGEEISAKLDQMEQVVSRIFGVVKEHPEVAPELGKLMSYYLPTTKKLLDAYRELDHQPIAGENISATKREIEVTIDTLNAAFEKLLDSLFVDKAWDISSDISVLNTILAQDGLKNDGLKSN